MRFALLAVVLSACGGGGRCENPPCEAPEPTCHSDEDCFGSELCDFARDTCGTDLDDIGHCVRRPSGCPRELDLVCGCDGVTYTNPCDAASMGVDIDRNGGCTAPPDGFACGPRFCDATSQVCIETKFGPEATDFHCEQFPTQCRSNPTCACLDPMGFQDCRATGRGFTLSQEVVADPAATSSAAAPSASTAASR